MRCVSCGSELSPRAKFCSECGEAVVRVDGPASSRTGEGVPPSRDGERRQLTVLFSDLVGSTAMASRLDPEDFRDVVRAYQSACSAAVARFGGYVAQYLGDGLVAYFGFPTAHEDDAFRATRAALATIDAVTALGPELARHQVRLAVRVGVHTGTVVMGEMGSSVRRETLALGDTTSVAARLQEVAAPNTVAVSDTTFRLIRRHFATEELGLHALKGVVQPVMVHRVVRALRRQANVAASQDLAVTPLVGRHQELGLLLDRWEVASERRGQVVTVSGEPGIGKSRLSLAFRQKLSEYRHTWLECRCSAYMQDTALHPIVSLQEDAIGLPALETPDQKVGAIERELDRLNLPVAEHLPIFTELHALPLPARHAPLALSPEAHRRRTLESLVQWIVRTSEAEPLALMIEDAHWIDPTTLELLERIVEVAPQYPMFILLTHRPGLEAPWSHGSHLTSIVLSRLTRSDAAELISHLQAGRGRLPEALVREIVSRSDGVPLFVEELSKAVLESDASLLHTDDEARKPLVPSSLQASLMARLDQLGPAKELAQHCAMLGREFSPEVVRATAPVGEEEIDRALERLVSAELFQRRGEPPVYSFRHVLMQEQAYESLLKTARQAQHGRIAEVLSTQFPQLAANQPELLAHHHDEAGQAEAALGHWLAAGQKSIARSANVEASRQLRRGLDALARLPPSEDRDQKELFLLTMRGVALVAVRGYASSEVEHTFARARELCHRLGDTPHLFPVLFGLCLFYMVRADAIRATELANQLESIAASTGDAEYALEMHGAKASVYFWGGHFKEAHEHILRARTLFDPSKHAHHAFIYGQEPLAYGYAYVSLALWFLGYPEQAMLSAEKAVELAGRTRHPLTFVAALSFSADLHFHLRMPEGFAALAQRTYEVAVDHNLPMWIGFSSGMLGWARFARGERDEGILEIRAGLEAFRRTGADVNAAYFKSRLAQAYLATGRIQEGLEATHRALDHVSRVTLDGYYEAELHRIEGELLFRSPEPDLDGAQACFERALSVARSQSAKSLELRAAMSLGRLWHAQGLSARAVELLGDVYAWFTEGLDTPDLVDAKALLDGWRA